MYFLGGDNYKDDLLINCGLVHVVFYAAFLPINSLHD